VLGNWINRGDLIKVAEKIREDGPRLLHRLRIGPEARTRAQWGEAYRGTPPSDPLDIPCLRRRWRFKATGDPELDHRNYLARRYLQGRSGLTALSLGSGPGRIETAWAQTGLFARIDGIELSPELVADARARARKLGVDAIVRFHEGDAGRPPFPLPSYDLVISEGALHHLRPMNRVIPALASVLDSRGLLVMLEFCGPDRFQWTRGQLKLARQALAAIPAQWRLKDNGRLKRRVYRPGRLRMLLSDPSEAVESSRILPVMHQHFEALEEKPLGGTVVHLVFYEITRHFLQPDPAAARLLERVCALEEEGLRSGGITSDYWFGVYRPRV
jgi:SAM-dependent methyltransferase